MSQPDKAESPRQKVTSSRSSFSALRYRDFRLIWFGQFVSMVGSQMQTAAINWHLYVLTRSALALGMVGLVRVIPIILCSLVGGVVADATNRKRLILATQLVMLASAGLLALYTWSGSPSAWPIYFLTAISAAATAFENPARQALLPSLVPAADFTNAVSLGITTFNFATICGPALAGLLLSRFGPAPVYLLNAISFFAVIAAVLLISASGRPESSENVSPQRISLEAFKAGLSFVWKTPIIVQTMTLDFAATFFASASALLPIFAVEILHVSARGYGLLASSQAIGSVIAAIAMARLGGIGKQGRVVLAAVAIYGLATLGFSVSRTFFVSMAMLAMIGASDTVSTVLRQTIRQLVTPDYLRGRMTSVNMIFFMGGPQLGEFEAGVVARVLGAPASVFIGGVGCLIAVLIATLCSKNLREYQGAHHETATRIS